MDHLLQWGGWLLGAGCTAYLGAAAKSRKAKADAALEAVAQHAADAVWAELEARAAEIERTLTRGLADKGLSGHTASGAALLTKLAAEREAALAAGKAKAITEYKLKRAAGR